MENYKKLVESVEAGKPAHKAMMGLNLDGTPQSLRKLEDLINETYPVGEREYSFALAIFYGTYLAQIIMDRIKGAEIVDYDEDPYELSIVLTKAGKPLCQVFPIARANNFINGDRSDTIFGFYNMLQDIRMGRFDPSESVGNTVNTGRHYEARARKLSNEEEEFIKGQQSKFFNK